MTGNNLWPPYPYAECGVPVTLEADPVNLPYYGDLDATGRPAFLTGPQGQFLPADGEQTATDYYDTIDPGNATNPTSPTRSFCSSARSARQPSRTTATRRSWPSR